MLRFSIDSKAFASESLEKILKKIIPATIYGHHILMCEPWQKEEHHETLFA